MSWGGSSAAAHHGFVDDLFWIGRMCAIHTGMDSREIIADLHADGWIEVSHRGSHVQFKHPTKPGRVTVPHPRRDVPIGTLRSIEKQAVLQLRRSK